MSHAGRKPMGPALVQHLPGSERAKQRLEVILETIAGQGTIDQACQRLGVSPAMFHQLRTDVLAAGLARLEPQPLGRPPHRATTEEARCEDLERRIAELESELKLAVVREEIARVMPHLTENDPQKKKRLAPRKRCDADA
jgi:hypothetical protein